MRRQVTLPETLNFTGNNIGDEGATAFGLGLRCAIRA